MPKFFGEPVLVYVEDLCCEPLLVDVEELDFQFSKRRFLETMFIVFSIVDFPPFGFVSKPFWSIHMFLEELWLTSGRLRP